LPLQARAPESDDFTGMKMAGLYQGGGARLRLATETGGIKVLRRGQ
jgi:hypothetical protein